MAAWSAADVVAFAPEFCDVPLPIIDRTIALVSSQVRADCWGDTAKLAGTLLTAHYLLTQGASEYQRATTAGATEAARDPSSVTVGSVTVSYGSGSNGGKVNPSRASLFGLGLSGTDALLVTTVYGAEFLRLRNQTFLGASLV